MDMNELSAVVGIVENVHILSGRTAVFYDRDSKKRFALRRSGNIVSLEKGVIYLEIEEIPGSED